jgi:hypothetical protein
MTHFPASPGTVILSLQEDESVIRVPVVGYEVIGSVAYPISVIPTGGLLKARRALMADGFVIDRGFSIPFDSLDAWIAWAKNQEPDEENTDPGTPVTEKPQESAKEMQARLQRENAHVQHPDVTGSTRRAQTRKTFASKSFWMKQNVNGSVEIAEIEKGYGLPLDHEGWEKIKREEFADFKRQAKAEGNVEVITWGQDGPVEPETQQQEAEVIEDDTGLV